MRSRLLAPANGQEAVFISHLVKEQTAVAGYCCFTVTAPIGLRVFGEALMRLSANRY